MPLRQSESPTGKSLSLSILAPTNLVDSHPSNLPGNSGQTDHS
jgi:hypothetical protein